MTAATPPSSIAALTVLYGNAPDAIERTVEAFDNASRIAVEAGRLSTPGPRLRRRLPGAAARRGRRSPASGRRRPPSMSPTTSSTRTPARPGARTGWPARPMSDHVLICNPDVVPEGRSLVRLLETLGRSRDRARGGEAAARRAPEGLRPRHRRHVLGLGGVLDRAQVRLRVRRRVRRGDLLPLLRRRRPVVAAARGRAPGGEPTRCGRLPRQGPQRRTARGCPPRPSGTTPPKRRCSSPTSGRATTSWTRSGQCLEVLPRGRPPPSGPGVRMRRGDRRRSPRGTIRGPRRRPVRRRELRAPQVRAVNAPDAVPPDAVPQHPRPRRRRREQALRETLLCSSARTTTTSRLLAVGAGRQQPRRRRCRGLADQPRGCVPSRLVQIDRGNARRGPQACVAAARGATCGAPRGRPGPRTVGTHLSRAASPRRGRILRALGVSQEHTWVDMAEATGQSVPWHPRSGITGRLLAAGSTPSSRSLLPPPLGLAAHPRRRPLDHLRPTVVDDPDWELLVRLPSWSACSTSARVTSARRGRSETPVADVPGGADGAGRIDGRDRSSSRRASATRTPRRVPSRSSRRGRRAGQDHGGAAAHPRPRAEPRGHRAHLEDSRSGRRRS